MNLFVCPKCHGSLAHAESALICQSCNAHFPCSSGIPQFYEIEKTWEIRGYKRLGIENISDWEDFLTKSFSDPSQRSWISDISRTMTLALGGIEEGTRVLDIGAGWGIYSIAAAKLGARVWAIDANPEGMGFLAKRCQIEKYDRLVAAQGSALSLPFPDDSFDLVMFNGVLELLPEYVETKSPEDIQCLALQEARRVLRPYGQLLIAIENRYGLVYLTGAPDEHTGVRFITLLPRWIASWYSRSRRKRPFRIYTHSGRNLKKLLVKGGFVPTRDYGVYPNYRFPDYVYSLSRPSAVRHLVARLRGTRGETRSGRIQSRIFRFLAEFSSLPAYMFRKLPSSLVVVGSKHGIQTDGLSSAEVRRTKLGWLERRANGRNDFICRYVLDDRLFATFKREGEALHYFAESGKPDLVPKVFREEERPGARIRVMENIGNADLLEELQEAHWSPRLQVEAFHAFLRWLESARKISAKGFPHKYEVMPWILRTIEEEPRIARLVRDTAITDAPAMLSNADFNPSNMTFTNGKIVIFDWECPCREHPIMALGHFFLQMTIFADRYPPLFRGQSKRPERCIGEIFRQGLHREISLAQNQGPVPNADVYLWIAMDFTAQFSDCSVTMPHLQEVLARLTGSR